MKQKCNRKEEITGEKCYGGYQKDKIKHDSMQCLKDSWKQI